jgi:hypothetical protein
MVNYVLILSQEEHPHLVVDTPKHIHYVEDVVE